MAGALFIWLFIACTSHPLVHNVIYHTAEDLHRIRKNLLVDIEDAAVTRTGFVGEDAHEGRLSRFII